MTIEKVEVPTELPKPVLSSVVCTLTPGGRWEISFQGELLVPNQVSRLAGQIQLSYKALVQELRRKHRALLSQQQAIAVK